MQYLVRAVAVALVLFGSTAAWSQDRDREGIREERRWGDSEEEILFLPDGRDLPPLPRRLEGHWTRDQGRNISWKADLAEEGDRFVGKVRVGNLDHLAPLTVQGRRRGDIIEFSVRFSKREVSYFAGHIAGSSIVGVMETSDGKGGEWAGTWIGDSLTITQAVE